MPYSCYCTNRYSLQQALIYALSLNPERTDLFNAYNTVFSRDGQSLVKGIFFFGTPFEGSQIANHGSKFVKFLGGNSLLINSLKDHAEDLTDIVPQFAQLQNSLNSKIAVCVACETQPLYGFRLVCTKST